MNYTLSHIATVIGAPAPAIDWEIDQLLLDSRKVPVLRTDAPGPLFFALKGNSRNGHQFIPELYEKGIRSFVISQPVNVSLYPEAVFLQVPDSLDALQKLAAVHRSRFAIPVIGITGSNGKTIVKEWLAQLLDPGTRLVRSPKSYNSQIGVPLSVWQLNEQTELAIFEAGISLPDEMDRLERIIQPQTGILTNIGEAHSKGFKEARQKAIEKLKLFVHCERLVYSPDHLLPDDLDVAAELASLTGGKIPMLYTWSRKQEAWLTVERVQRYAAHTLIEARRGELPVSFEIPFTDEASVENALTCCCTLLMMEYTPAVISERMKHLQRVDMRLELKKGINQCTLINDSYSADVNSLRIALDFLDQQSGWPKRTVILSDLLQSADPDPLLYARIINELKHHHITRLIGIGQHISVALEEAREAELLPEIEWYADTETFLQRFLSTRFREEMILVKGARVFGFERIVQVLEQKVHQTVLEINLNALVHNVKLFQEQLRPGVKVMAMVKAFAYGSGGAEIAGILQFHKIDYLGVAYADEGAELRRAGISLPIMVMNPEPTAFDLITEYNLEPDLYSFAMLRAFEAYLKAEGRTAYPVHIEIETGMNRLGFAPDEVPALATALAESPWLHVQSVFSHLAASEDPAEDEYTMAQFDRYHSAVEILQKDLNYSFIRHISNTAAISRLPQLQLDMVRLGIGMYGVDSAGIRRHQLEPAATLKTTIAQIKQLKKGESVSYNRRGKVERDSLIATVRIGYADGYSRRLGNGVGKVWIAGHLAPVIGTVCMDMTMVDVTDIPGVREGDTVILFGRELPVQDLAGWAGTIPYEIMTGISQRVKRVYYEE
ncbi:bifunctional UDP-N-acetylmuramoyl-tripeptide:D-alanyl-D-alanine ligase/alanine racemase [Nostoc ellipsosporum NOK]|nr:bifunctional UDP-N-acetylmuramoyl-tripeptide:D-alanyl-D-alanine ligase/alanine racemase [Nostoc ellipsosporum NOK]